MYMSGKWKWGCYYVTAMLDLKGNDAPELYLLALEGRADAVGFADAAHVPGSMYSTSAGCPARRDSQRRACCVFAASVSSRVASRSFALSRHAVSVGK